ncbi:hypothetical protein MSAN_00179000 [Mycena sanguinolenta]|uniref:Uncharacterized protein n=1 Tax=Mycena sanguinolenta TaxID=230812 RepID=A0A8H6ZGX4_9AGAR|nr:hypothetical protein MSAN_00179000 [Mycena sanguinolenta]
MLGRCRPSSISAPSASPYPTRGIHIHLNPSDPGRHLRSGECDRCVGIMYEDEWIPRERGTLIPDFRGVDSVDRPYLKPPALETVEWTFWHDEVDENDEHKYEEEEDEEQDGDEDGDDDDHDDG